MRMSRLTLIAVVVGLLAWPGHRAEARARARARGKAGDPLAPLVAMGKRLQRAGDAALRGKTSAEAGRMRLSVRPRTLRKLRQAGVRSVRLVGFELELLFHQAGRATYYLRTFVHPGPRRVRLMGLKGRKPAGGKLYVTGHAPARYQGVAAPFRQAAHSLVRSAGTAACRGLALADAAVAKRLGVQGRLAQRLLRDARRARRNRPTVCQELAAVKRHRMTLRIDDVAYLARDARGRLVGLIKGDLRLKGRTLELRLRGFRALPP
jgi:hypothetical protein